MREVRKTKTVDLCYHKDKDGDTCEGSVQWKLKTEKGHTFKVCDQHLAHALRFAGLPALVEEFKT